MATISFNDLAVGSTFFYQEREFTVTAPYETITRDAEGNLVPDENQTGWLAIHAHEEGFNQKIVVTPENFEALQLSLTAPAPAPQED